MGSAVGPSVGLGGLAALGVGDDVVDLAVLSRHVAAGELAAPVPDLDRPSQGAGEEAFPDPDVDDPGGCVEHDPFDVGFGEEGQELVA